MPTTKTQRAQRFMRAKTGVSNPFFAKRTHSGSWCPSRLCGLHRKLRNEAMRSARRFEVPGSRFKVRFSAKSAPSADIRIFVPFVRFCSNSENYETNPMRSARQFKVSSSKFNVFEIAKRTHSDLRSLRPVAGNQSETEFAKRSQRLVSGVFYTAPHGSRCGRARSTGSKFRVQGSTFSKIAKRSQGVVSGVYYTHPAQKHMGTRVTRPSNPRYPCHPRLISAYFSCNDARSFHNSRGLKIPLGVMIPVIKSGGVTSKPGLRALLEGLATRT